MSDVDFSIKEQLMAAQEGLRRGLLADSHIDAQKEQARRERLYSLSDDEFFKLIGRTSTGEVYVAPETIVD